MKNIGYEKLEEIVVKSQEELDMIPLNFKGRIYIEFGTYFNRAIVKNNYYNRVVARENSTVVAWGNSTVEAWGNSTVEARENSTVEAWENSTVVARGNSTVVARGNSSVEAQENSTVEAWGNSTVVARGNSTVEAWGNSTVEAWGNSTVVARGNSTVVARGNSSVEAQENSTVEARENSTVEAWGNSTVEAQGNCQVVDCSNAYNKPKIKISGNARIVYNPKNITEYMDFYNIKHTKTKATFYKAVRKRSGKYISDYKKDFEYEIGKMKRETCDTDVNESCSNGIHISNLNWALRFGATWDDLAIIEVETKIKDIVVPLNTDGKVRTSEVKVIREVPLGECGLYGKIIERRRNNVNS